MLACLPVFSSAAGDGYNLESYSLTRIRKKKYLLPFEDIGIKISEQEIFERKSFSYVMGMGTTRKRGARSCGAGGRIISGMCRALDLVPGTAGIKTARQGQFYGPGQARKAMSFK